MSDKCPECGAALEYDEVDIGVGVQRGPGYCIDCGWTSTDAEVEEPSNAEVEQEE